MEAIKNTVFSLCLTAVFGSVLFYLLPKGSFQKLFRLIFCLFFLCSLTTPLIKGSFENWLRMRTNEREERNITIMTEDIFEKSEEFFEKELERKTREFLANRGITPEKIDVDAHISKDGSITMERFSLILAAKDVFPELDEKIEEAIGIKPELLIQKEDENEGV